MRGEPQIVAATPSLETLANREIEERVDQHVLVIVVRRELDPKVEAAGAGQPLQGRQRGILPPALDAGDLTLRAARAPAG
jgi:hypothetical protein